MVITLVFIRYALRFHRTNAEEQSTETLGECRRNWINNVQVMVEATTRAMDLSQRAGRLLVNALSLPIVFKYP